MTCSEKRRELKYKFPPCPCQKCAQSRDQNSTKQSNRTTNQCFDTPPEGPLPKYRFQPKCAAKLESIEPKFHRKRSSWQQGQQKCQTCDERMEQCLKKSDGYCTGQGCCNTKCNFMCFMISVIGYFCFLFMAILIFWLAVCYTFVVLGFKVYHSNRKTKVAAVSVISVIFLLIFCAAALKTYRRHSINRPETKSLTAVNDSSSWTTYFKWGRRSPQVGKFSPEQPPLKKNEARSSWLPSFGWAKSSTVTEVVLTQSPFSWLPSFKWSKQEIEKKPEERTSWMLWSKSLSGPPSPKKAETRSAWIPWKANSVEPKKTESRFSWLPSLGWSQTTTKETEKTTATRRSWLLWRATTSTQSAPKVAAHSSWIPSLRWDRRTETISASTKPEARTSWTSYLQWGKATPPSATPPSPNPPIERTSWMYYFKWGPPKQTEDKAKTSEIRYSWLSTFNWGRSSSASKEVQPFKQQKVTVSIDDEKARQIFQQSKLYSIPMEMKYPPKLVIYLRDFVQRLE